MSLLIFGNIVQTTKKKLKKSKLLRFVYLHLVTVDFLNLSVLDKFSTINHIENGGSVIRFGDGELLILFKKGAPAFQKYSDKLRNDLLQILFDTRPNLLLCLPRLLSNKDEFKKLTINSQFYWVRFLRKYSSDLKLLESSELKNRLFGDTQVTRFYRGTLDRQLSEEIFNRFKNILKNKEIFIFEGSKTRFGVGNDLLSEAKSVSRVLAPTTNAYERIDELKKISLNIPKKTLIIVSLGPAGKVISHFLVKRGYQVCDLGHLDIEYEWFRRRVSTSKPIPGKYVNEASIHYIPTSFRGLEKYKSEIVYSCVSENEDAKREVF